MGKYDSSIYRVRPFVEKVKEKITPDLLATYPVKENLIELLAEHNDINKHNITVTAGSEEAMRLVFQCFAQKGKVLLTVCSLFRFCSYLILLSFLYF